jgi:hypothetical protein
MRRASTTRKSRGLLFTALPLVLAAATLVAFVAASKASQLTPGFTPISLRQAVSSFQRHPGTIRNDIPGPGRIPPPAPAIRGFVRPAAGVYAYRTTGVDWVASNGQKYVRHFPATTYATVLHGSGCVWEVWFNSAEEYVDGHRQCSAPGAYLCLAHIGTVRFAGFTKTLTHVCKPTMRMVAGKAAHPGGQEQTTCVAKGQDVAKIVIDFIDTENVVVAGQTLPAYHVKLISYVSGSVKGKSAADVWFDERTGMYLKMIRTENIAVRSSGEIGTYNVRISYQLASLTPHI